MKLNEYRNKEARTLAKLIAIAFEAGRITKETHDAGWDASMCMEADHREGDRHSESTKADHAARLEKFNVLFERDTGPRGDAGVSP